MNQELFEHMRKQMTPGPEVRAALSEKLAQPVKKRPVSWKKYGALAACAALIIGTFTVYSYGQESGQWMFFVRSFNRDVIDTELHSYVTVDGPIGYIQENAATNDTGTGAAEILPGGAYVGDAPSQEEALQAQANLSPYVRSMPDWFGGLYFDSSGTLVVCLVESEDPGDKSLELQVQKWACSDRVAFTDVKYSLAHLDALMDRLNHLPETDPECRGVMASWARDEMNNRVIVTLTEANDHMLSILAEMDPDDDAIYVQVGQRASTDSANTEAPAVYHVIPGGDSASVPDDEDLIAEEPYYDGAHYDVEHLPEELPEEKRPALAVDSFPEEDASTSSWFPRG